jgi:hypothetical protein
MEGVCPIKTWEETGAINYWAMPNRDMGKLGKGTQCSVCGKKPRVVSETLVRKAGAESTL